MRVVRCRAGYETNPLVSANGENILFGHSQHNLTNSTVFPEPMGRSRDDLLCDAFAAARRITDKNSKQSIASVRINRFVFQVAYMDPAASLKYANEPDIIAF